MAAETACRVNLVLSKGCTTRNTLSRWLKRFQHGNLERENESRKRPSAKINNQELDSAMVADRSQSGRALARMFDVRTDTILAHLDQITEMDESDQWMSRSIYQSDLK